MQKWRCKLITSKKLLIPFQKLTVSSSIFSELNQGLIISKGGGQLLANMASKTDDPQTLRMVAGAIANLCGNGKLKVF